MNIGVVLPQDGYLAAVREITQKHDVLLIFDEVKTGITIAAGGAVERFGVTPDIVTLAKALGGGLPSGAIGGSEEVMASIESGLVYQVGTYNGNPLSMAAARASFQEVMTPDAYVHLEHLNDRLHEGLGAIIEQARLPGARDRPRRQGLHRLLARPDPQLPRLGAQDERPAERARVALQHEPRRLHDARVARRSGRSRCSTTTPTSTASSTSSRSLRATSRREPARPRGARGARAALRRRALHPARGDGRAATAASCPPETTAAIARAAREAGWSASTTPPSTAGRA